MSENTTWKPSTEHGKLDTEDRNNLPESVYAFPKERKEPLTDAQHVKNALARFDQVEGVTDAERDQAFANIKKAAKHYGIDVQEKSWRELGSRRTARVRLTRTRTAISTKREERPAPGSAAGRNGARVTHVAVLRRTGLDYLSIDPTARAPCLICLDCQSLFRLPVRPSGAFWAASLL